MNPTNLARLLRPTSIAVVGASEKLGMSNNAVLPMLDRAAAGGPAPARLHLVNPNRDSVYDVATVPSLTAIGEPVDAVLSLVSAARSIDVVAEAAALGCGGVAVAAGGFAELGDEGRELQARLVDAAGDLAVVGPNCSGFMNVGLGANLFTGGRISLAPGGVAVVSQSGFLLRSTLAAGQQRQLGFGIAVSSGNEAVCELHDYLDVLATDDDTRVICLVIEKIRSADAFFGAIERVRQAGKAVVAVKLGRTERSRDIMRSHTGAIADESWVYDLVLRELGVVTAVDIDDLLDQAQLLAQLPIERWSPVGGVAVMASSGGVAGVAADTAVIEQVSLPALDALAPWVHERVPGEGSVNPLDLTGFVMRDRDLLLEMFDGYANADGVDALVLCWWAGENDEGWSRTLLEPFAEVARRAGIPLVVSPVEATAVGSWTRGFHDDGLAFCRGLRSTYRALRALDRVARSDVRPVARTTSGGGEARPALLTSEAGPIASFADAMRRLEAAGVPVAPYVVLEPDAEAPFADADTLGERLVVKLADVPHRTELGAVRVGVAATELAATVDELRAVARSHGVPATVAVQAMVTGVGEAFVGIQGRTDLGPILLFGLGGVLVEVAGQVDGVLLPLAPGDAARLVERVAGDAAFARLRGQTRWAPEPLVAAIEAVAALWERERDWLASADLNPLVVTADGVVAVDALLVGE
ncbi:MAG TPA: acetate--CoA ligase family protein [Acidimicrobiia bacterium]|nr:acetate--CoA ligase family protein [Acidimicrobiia bacterium]